MSSASSRPPLAEGTPLLAVEHVVKAYGDVVVLREDVQQRNAHIGELHLAAAQLELAADDPVLDKQVAVQLAKGRTRQRQGLVAPAHEPQGGLEEVAVGGVVHQREAAGSLLQRALDLEAGLHDGLGQIAEGLDDPIRIEAQRQLALLQLGVGKFLERPQVKNRFAGHGIQIRLIKSVPTRFRIFCRHVMGITPGVILNAAGW